MANSKGNGVMNEKTLVALIIFWVVCGVLNYGFYVAHFQRKYASIAEETATSDRIYGVIVFFTGPFGLFSIIINGFYKHGWML
jgi:hypothetical protein